jgi:hypothetical protein
LRLVERSLAQIPADVHVDVSVDLSADDPALVNGRRLCVATRRSGGRCRAAASPDGLLCNAHAGRLDPSAGGRARAAKWRMTRNAAEERASVARLGTREVVAQALLEKQEKVAAAVRLLVDDAADESAPHAQRLRSAQALIPWINQALGTPVERVEQRAPTVADEIASMSNEQLQALVAAGRPNQRAPEEVERTFSPEQTTR